MERTVELPALDDPDVKALASRAMDRLRAHQRPWLALGVGLLSAAITTGLWAELYGRFGQLPWLADAALAAGLGATVGWSMRLGKIVERRWSVLAILLGACAATLGDVGAVLWRLREDYHLAGYAEAFEAVGGLRPLLEARSPLDWFVSGLAGLTAGLASRPWSDEAQAIREAQLRVLRQREAELEDGDFDDGGIIDARGEEE